MASQSKAKKIVLESNTLPGVDSLYVSNFLINSAIQAYVNQFNSRVVPFSFVSMFFDALQKSKNVQASRELVSFFSDKSTSTEIYCYIYFLTFKQVVGAIIEDSKYGSAFVLKKAQAPLTLALFSRETPRLQFALEVLQQEQLAFINQEPNYIKKAFALYLAGINTYIQDALTEKAEENEIETNDLVGKEINIQNQKGKKIYQLFIPSLPLPTKYPCESPRVHSSYHAQNFAAPSKALDLITNLQIVRIKYSTDFVELRNAAKPKKEEKKLNWSDFF